MLKIIFLILFTVFGLQLYASEGLDARPTYEENRSEFLRLANQNKIQTWPVQNHSELTTDLALYNNKSENLLVLSSGLHGIEGYVGSALQRKLMQSLSSSQNIKTDVLLIHALNPWGMKYNRRVNERNIDLNRSFSIDRNLYATKNTSYQKINSFLNPNSKLALNYSGYVQHATFLFNSVRMIVSYGRESLRKSILLGQYSEQKGLYFGGQGPDTLQFQIDNLIKNSLTKYKKIVWIDLHTGYGEKNKLHILANDSNAPSGQKISKLFNGHPVDFGNQKKFYKSNGDLCEYLNSKSKPTQEITATVFEYGTMDSQTTLGSIESLRRMVIENQGFHYGYDSLESKNKSSELFKNMFFPQNPEWQKTVLDQTQELLEPLLGISLR